MRSRVHRGQVVRFPVPAVPVGEIESVHAAALVELGAAGRVGTSLGQAALVLARRIDAAAEESGQGASAMVRELRATLEDAMRGATVIVDGVDELRARREGHVRRPA